MRKKVTLYLDTSVPSQLFHPPEWMKNATIRFYSEVIPHTLVFISERVVSEIERTPDPTLRRKIFDAVKDFQILSESNEAVTLAEEYVEYLKRKNISLPLRDALHVAIATVEGIQYIVTWNMEHLAKESTRKAVSTINYLYRYTHLNIVTPTELLL